MQYTGVDVSSEKLDVSAPKRPARTFPNTASGVEALVDWLLDGTPREEAHVIVEPTSTYHQLLVQVMARRGVAYTVINPARTAAFAKVQGKRAKTDRIDARLLADFGESQEPSASPPPDEAQEQLRALRRHLDWLREEIQTARNRLETARRSPWTPRSVLGSLERTVREREQEAERIGKELRAHVERDERWWHDVDLLMTIPSIGWTSAVLLLSEMPPVPLCASAKSWVAFAGVCPAPDDSGKRHASYLSRVGSARVRSGLYLPAVSASRWNPGVRALTQRLHARAKPGKVRNMAAMGKLLRQCFGVLKSGLPYDPLIHQPPSTA